MKDSSFVPTGEIDAPTGSRSKRPISLALLTMSICYGCHTAFGADQRAPFNQKPYTQPQQLVSIAPGRRLNLYCTGKGSPTVVLDSVWGGPTTAWAYVQPELSRVAQVCSYDRAGQGFSDPGPLPRDTDALVSDLHALLRAAHIKPPYVLVGHSLAGLDTILFADRYLSDLGGMVLVDPASAHEEEKMKAIPGVATPLANLYPDFSPCQNAAEQRRLPTEPALIDRCLDRDPTFSPALTSALDNMSLRPTYWIDRQSEMNSYGSILSKVSGDIDSPELHREARKFGAWPIVVLTAGNNVDIPGSSAEQRLQLHDLTMRGHDALAALSTQGSNLPVPGSTHYIQFDKPGVVIAAIRNVVQQARTAGRSLGK